MDADKVRDSGSYRKARDSAEQYANDPERLGELVSRASRKADRNRQGPIGRVWTLFTACLRMLKAYAKGEYRDVSWQSLLLIIASIVYFVSPLDLIPDFLLGLGLIDDAALLGWTLQAVKADIERFIEWENGAA